MTNDTCASSGPSFVSRIPPGRSSGEIPGEGGQLDLERGRVVQKEKLGRRQGNRSSIAKKKKKKSVLGGKSKYQGYLLGFSPPNYK